MECPRCKKDPTPIFMGGIEMRPCGQVEENRPFVLPEGMKMDCPMWEWQTGFLSCLLTMKDVAKEIREEWKQLPLLKRLFPNPKRTKE